MMAQEEKDTKTKAPDGPSRESAYAALNGVSVDWLRRVFHLSAPKCESKLRGLRVVAVTNKGVPLYDLGEAAERLVKPKLDLNEYLADITVDDLPDRLKETFWNSKLKQQRFEKNAGELWRTEAVIQVFGSVLKDIKERLRLVNTMAESTLAMDQEQLAGLRQIVEDIQGEVYNHIMNLSSKTPASIAELNNELGEEDEVDYESPTAIKAREDDDFEY